MAKMVDKIKTVVKEHNKEIIGVSCLVIGSVLGYKASAKVCQLQIGAGLLKANNDGFVLFKDPNTGLDITLEECTKLINEANGK